MTASAAGRLRPGLSQAGLLAAIAGASCYGFNIPAAKVAANVGLAGPALIALRAALFLGCAGAAYIVLGWRPTVSPGQGRRLLGLGLLSALTATGYISSLATLPVSLAVVLFYTFPLWIILAVVARDGRDAAARLGPFALAFAGVTLSVGGEIAGADVSGVALALGASLCSAVLFLRTPGVGATGPATLLWWTQWPCLVVGLATLPLLGATPTGPVLAAAALPALIAGLAFFVGFVLQIVATRKLDAAPAGLLFLLEPVIAILVASTWLGETLGTRQIVGVGLVLAGLALDVPLEQRRLSRRARALP